MDTLHILLAISPVWLKVIQFFVALSILIVIHEFGHYLAARLTKTRVEKFYLFFDFFFPLSNVLNFSLFKKKIGDTEYGLGWFPLGGYVSIAGMVDETKDLKDMPEEPQPWEYRSKKSWQKLLIMLGGVIMNVLLALLIYTVVFVQYGETYLPPERATNGMAYSKLFKDIGFQDGDVIVKVGDKKPKGVRKIFLTAFLEEAKTFTILRNGEEKNINIPEGTIGAVLKSKRFDMISPRIPFIIDSIPKESPNYTGLKKGDKFLSINSKSVPFVNNYLEEFKKAKYVSQVVSYLKQDGDVKIYNRYFSDETISRLKESSLDSIRITILRNNQEMDYIAKLDTAGILNVGYVADMDSFFNVQRDSYSFLQSIPRAFSFTGEQIRDYLVQLRLIFTSPEIKISESVGGFISIGKIFPGEFDMRVFLMLTAMISLVLAVMNLIPIPGLDGGYVLFLLIEMISGRKMPESFIEKANGVGLILLLALMLYVNGLDVWREWLSKFF